LIASFTVTPANPDTGSTVNFTASATGGLQPYNYTWSFGDGSKGKGQTTRYVYKVVGNYTVNLTVADTSKQTAKTSQGISIDTEPKPTPASPSHTNTAFPRTLGLMISLVIGVALPLALSLVVSRRHRRITRSP